eukprot:CAMPEP_0202686042 /NCGR_PEP_ID=MMETSP1385-20130828/1838_1 /ASSEMBLY_ACC=CAM_ASM_000861 /TAXON_ID=933848 /ORGANISM="Elphidium margaritaceum" /LENGTH=456 /DNA_ID=CAMNT_0049340541 /DNA_START=177 /DNA_END=1544 /DNA_ORIENTATION=+
MIKDNAVALPAMFIDLDVFERNVEILAGMAKKHDKTLRIATKSIRCPYLIEHAMRVSNGVFKGFECFSVHEANALVEYAERMNSVKDKHDTFDYLGTFNDFLIAYPITQASEIEVAYKLTQKGIRIALVVDSSAHVTMIDDICNTLYCKQATTTTTTTTPTSSRNGPMPRLSVCIDLDMSYRVQLLGIRIGAHRSCVSNELDLNIILNDILKSRFVQLAGVIGYNDDAKAAAAAATHSFWYTCLLRSSVIRKQRNQRRQAMVQFIRNKINALQTESTSDAEHSSSVDIDAYKYGSHHNLAAFAMVNAGITSTVDQGQLRVCTEVSAGATVLQSRMFDECMDGKCQPAVAFALPITRIATPEQYVVCQSGGFIASGPVSSDKEPVVFLPRNQIYGAFDGEGFGEVQTPLMVKDASYFQYGDAVFFRPATSGETAERFNEYILKRGDEIVLKVPTYRG